MFFFFFQAEDGIRDGRVTGVQTCALPISSSAVSALNVVACGRVGQSETLVSWHRARARGSMTILLFMFALIASARQHEAHAPAERPATLMSGLGNLHHPIATRSREAQQFFDQGLTLVYGFNHDEAVRSFRRAAELDPSS